MLNELTISTDNLPITADSLYVNNSLTITGSDFDHTSIIFGVSKMPKMIVMTEDTFLFKGEPVSDAQGVYEKMCEFLSIALDERKNPVGFGNKEPDQN